MGEYKEKIKNYYDDFAETWDNRFSGKSKAFQFFLNKRLHMLKEKIGEYNALVDAGCGTGFYILNILEEGKEGVGFDISPMMIKEAVKNKNEKFPQKNISFIVDDGENLSIENNKFDRAICVGYLIHLENPQKALSEIFRILAPGGLIVGLVSNRWSPWFMFGLRKFFGKNYGVVEGDKEVSPPEMKQMLMDAGFSDIKLEIFNTLPGKIPNWAYYPSRFLNMFFSVYPFSLFGWHILFVGRK